MDFKENIKLGGGPIELGNDFYNRQQCSVLGMAVVHCNQVTKQPRLHYIDFFSDILSHDALFVSHCVKKMLHKFLNNPNITGQQTIKKVHFWTDTGRHFQCGELAHFLLNFLPVTFGIQVTWNFFAEHHGKNIVDGHFGLLSRTIKDLEKNTYLDTLPKLIGCLGSRFFQNNLVSTNRGVNFNFYTYDRESRDKNINILNIKNLCDFYYFESSVVGNKIRIRAKVFTNSGIFIDNLNPRVKNIEDKRQTKRGSIATQESRPKKTSQAGQHQEVRVFGPVTAVRILRRRQLSGRASGNEMIER